jgi:hypothetical protein
MRIFDISARTGDAIIWFCHEHPARSPSGKAKVCKTFIGGSIPPRASILFVLLWLYTEILAAMICRPLPACSKLCDSLYLRGRSCWW